MASAQLQSSTSDSETILHLTQRLESVEAQLEKKTASNELTLVVFSGELDKLMAAYNIANAAASCGMKVSMFFTFWGAAALKKKTLLSEKTWVERAFGILLPGGLGSRKLSRLDMLGIGRHLMGREMNQKNIPSLSNMVDTAAKLGVDLYICEMSMNLMGIRESELIDYPNKQFCGAAKFLSLANKSNTSLFM
jgi:peroxiredoxin family protein